jgi:hypothetical protein
VNFDAAAGRLDCTKHDVVRAVSEVVAVQHFGHKVTGAKYRHSRVPVEVHIEIGIRLPWRHILRENRHRNPADVNPESCEMVAPFFASAQNALRVVIHSELRL